MPWAGCGVTRCSKPRASVASARVRSLPATVFTLGLAPRAARTRYALAPRKEAACNGVHGLGGLIDVSAQFHETLAASRAFASAVCAQVVLASHADGHHERRGVALNLIVVAVASLRNSFSLITVPTRGRARELNERAHGGRSPEAVARKTGSRPVRFTMGFLRGASGEEGSQLRVGTAPRASNAFARPSMLRRAGPSLPRGA